MHSSPRAIDHQESVLLPGIIGTVGFAAMAWFGTNEGAIPLPESVRWPLMPSMALRGWVFGSVRWSPSLLGSPSVAGLEREDFVFELLSESWVLGACRCCLGHPSLVATLIATSPKVCSRAWVRTPTSRRHCRSTTPTCSLPSPDHGGRPLRPMDL